MPYEDARFSGIPPYFHHYSAMLLFFSAMADFGGMMRRNFIMLAVFHPIPSHVRYFYLSSPIIQRPFQEHE
jgi:hypothetical protein